MKRIFSIFAALVAVVAMVAPTAEASILGATFTTDGTIDVIADDSRGIFIDRDAISMGDGDGVLGTIDLIQGIVSLPNSSGTDPGTVFGTTGGNLYGAYSIALTEGSPGAFTGSTPGPGYTIADMLGFGTATGVDDSALITRDGSITPVLAIFEAPSGVALNDTAFTNVAAVGSPLSLAFLGLTDLSGFSASLTAGFDGVDDFHSVTLFLSPGTPGGPAGLFDGAYTVAADIFGSGVTFLPLTDSAGVVSDIAVGTSAGDPDGLGSIEALSQGGFTFADSGNFLLNPVPEPTSFLVWSGLALLGMFSSRRRRRLYNN